MAAPAGPARVPLWVPFFNPIARRLLAAGVPMGPNALITIAGRKTGLPRSTPITVIEDNGRRWVLAPFGEVNWVRNLRAAGRATLTLRRRAVPVVARELSLNEAEAFYGDILSPLVRRYGRWAMWIVRNIDRIDLEDPVQAAHGRPVFELSRPEN